MTSSQYLTKFSVTDLESSLNSFEIEYNLCNQNVFFVIKGTLKAFFMQKILKMTKMCQYYDVIMMSRQHPTNFSALDLTFSLNLL